MKKFYSCIAILFIFLLTGCSTKPETSEAPTETISDSADLSSIEYIKELNDNSNLGIALNQDSGLTEEEAEQYGPDYPYTINLDGKDTNYYCFKYPLSDAPLSVTQIEILDEEFDVYGIHLGDTLDDSITILKSCGYSETTYPLNNMNQYTKGDINIILSFEENTIQRIVVSLNIVTEEGVMY